MARFASPLEDIAQLCAACHGVLPSTLISSRRRAVGVKKQRRGIAPGNAHSITSTREFGD